MLKTTQPIRTLLLLVGVASGVSLVAGGGSARAQWGGWESLGGVILEEPACVSWGSNRIDCFARGTNRAMFHRWWNGSAWGGWENLGGVVLEAPDCVSWGANRIDCFARGTDAAMYHRWWNGSSWGGWENLGGTILDSPECVSWGPNRIDCFARGTNSAMFHRWWNGSAWGGWENLGGVILERPSCVSWGPNRIDCFARGTNRAMFHRWWNGTSWNGWEDLGGILTTRPECVAWSTNRIDCFARGTNAAMFHRWWNGNAWGGWENLGGIILEQPNCVSWATNRIDCFARGTDEAMYHRWWDGSAWGGWENLGGVIREKPECVSWGANRLDCFGRGLDGAMWHRWWPCPACGLVNQNLQVSRFTTSIMANGDADAIFAAASPVLQVNHGAGDVACPVAFTRNGNVSVFATGDGSIDSAAEFNAVIGLPGWVKVVNQINWCGGLLPNVIGCAPVPGNSLAVVRFTNALEGILLAHEFGHNRGLSHRNDDPNAVMNGTIGATRLRVTAAECTAFQNTAAALVAAALVMPEGGSEMAASTTGPTTATTPMAQAGSETMPGGGAGMAPGPDVVPMPTDAVGMTPAPGEETMPEGGIRAETDEELLPDGESSRALTDVRDFVRQIFIHGVPYEEATQFGASAVPVLLEMLNDPQEAPYWANIVVVLGMIGGEDVIDPLIAFIEEDTPNVTREIHAAKTSALMSLGYILNRTGSPRVLNYLVESTSLETWEERSVEGVASFQPGIEERNEDFSKFAILGLALSGRPEAAEALRSLQRPTGSAEQRAFQAQVSDLISESLEENRKIAEEGLADYYEAEPH
jgi:hypothetical protein